MSSSSTPLVSVVVSTYNCQRFVEETLRSVLNQTYSHLELIVVDDGSTDNTLAIVASIEDPRMSVYSIPHSGKDSTTRNYGIQQAQGELLILFDGDDLYEPDAIERLVRHLVKHPEQVAAYGFFRKIDASGHLIPNQYEHLIPNEDGQLGVRPGFSHSMEKFLMGRDIPIQFQGLMIRRDVLLSLGGIPETFFQMSDKLFFGKLLLNYGNQVGRIDAYLFRYRMHSQNITLSDDRLANHLEAIFGSFDVIYGDPAFPADLRPNISYYTAIMLSEIYVPHKFATNCPHHARQILLQALACPHLKTRDWIRYCLLYYVGTWLPCRWVNQSRAVWHLQIKPWIKRHLFSQRPTLLKGAS